MNRFDLSSENSNSIDLSTKLAYGVGEFTSEVTGSIFSNSRIHEVQ